MKMGHPLEGVGPDRMYFEDPLPKIVWGGEWYMEDEHRIGKLRGLYTMGVVGQNLFWRCSITFPFLVSNISYNNTNTFFVEVRDELFWGWKKKHPGIHIPHQTPTIFPVSACLFWKGVANLLRNIEGTSLRLTKGSKALMTPSPPERKSFVRDFLTRKGRLEPQKRGFL